jgi:hypothetical protein
MITKHQDRPEVTDLTLPQLVREFASLKVEDAVADRGDAHRHARLGRVVTELRNRNALD